jgi:hypothetical protein
MDRRILRICIVNLCSWVGWFTFLLYNTDWFGRHIFEGLPDTTASEMQRQLYATVRSRTAGCHPLTARR